MSKFIMVLLIIAILTLCVLLFWIIILSLALLFFGRKGSKVNEIPPSERILFPEK